MLLSKQTVEILSNFSKINTNLVIRKGKKLETISPAKDIIVSYDGEDNFDTQVSIYNLNELLGVLSAMEAPELDLDVKSLKIFQGKQKVTYGYAEEALLITPPEKGIKFPVSDISFELSESTLIKLQKMSAILSAEDFSVVGNGKVLSLKIFDIKNPSTNVFELETEVECVDKFQVDFKMEKLKLYSGDYTVDISNQKISRFSNKAINLVYFVAVEGTSNFGDLV